MTRGDRLVIIMPQSIAAMVSFAAGHDAGRSSRFSGLSQFQGRALRNTAPGWRESRRISAAKAVVIDHDFPDEMLDCVALGRETKLIRAGDAR